LIFVRRNDFLPFVAIANAHCASARNSGNARKFFEQEHSAHDDEQSLNDDELLPIHDKHLSNDDEFSSVVIEQPTNVCEQSPFDCELLPNVCEQSSFVR
jgi:hypothetical protein